MIAKKINETKRGGVGTTERCLGQPSIRLVEAVTR